MKEMDEAVETVKNRDEWRREYMTLALEMERKLAEGEAGGLAEGLAESPLLLCAKGENSCGHFYRQ